MRKKAPWMIVFAAMFLLMLLGEVLAMAAVVRLDMLPDIYLVALGGVFVLLSLITYRLLFAKGKANGKGRKIVACVLAVLPYVAAVYSYFNDSIHIITFLFCSFPDVDCQIV